MAISLGGRFSASRQRATSQSSALESGPPETASSNAGTDCRSENNDLASAAEIKDSLLLGMILSENRFPLFGIMPSQQWTRFCSCATPRFTLAEARGNLRPASSN